MTWRCSFVYTKVYRWFDRLWVIVHVWLVLWYVQGTVS